MVQQMMDSPPPAPPPTECELLGGFSLLTQATLAIICIGVLLFKRARERPQRPWIVWLFDVSKQAFSSTLQHAVNVVIGLLLGRDSQASACSWYFVMYVLTSINALWLVALMMWAIEKLIERRGWHYLRSGEYGSPPTWRRWLPQLLVWGAVGVGEKLLTVVIIIVPLHSALGGLAVWLEAPLVNDPHAELVIVLIVTPLIMNIVTVWCFDNVIHMKLGCGRPRKHVAADASTLLPGAAASVQALDETSMRVGAYVPPAGDAPAPAPDPREHASRLSPH